MLALGALLAAAFAFLAVLIASVDRTAASPQTLAGHVPSSRPSGRIHARGTVPRTSATAFSVSPSFTLPFPPNRADRSTRPGEVPSLYDDGLLCSTGCRPSGAEIGWPLRPFHVQHPIRAGLNELRPESLHVGLDIQARDGAPVYAVQPGPAQVLDSSGPNARVEVGNYIYWHITPRVRTGQWVTQFQTVLGNVMSGYGHIAFSELGADGQYANPLRPGGTVLEPYSDHASPEIAKPAVSAEGQVVVSAYDPQTFIRKTTYYTPVLAPAAIAYRLYDSAGVPLTPLEWAFRGTHLLPFAQRSLIYAPGARDPGYECFASRSVCVPDWSYRLAGGLAPPLPGGLPPGHYRLAVYAWDWADNTTALDTTLTMTATGWRPIGRFPQSIFRMPGYLERDRLRPPVSEPVRPYVPRPTLPTARLPG